MFFNNQIKYLKEVVSVINLSQLMINQEDKVYVFFDYV